MTFAGLPLHPLVVHAAVVFTPLAALLVIAFAALPKWRWLSRWVTAGATVLAMASIYLAKLSGESFIKMRPELAPLVRTHEHRADILFWLMIGFTVLTAVGVWALGGPTALASGKGAWPSRVPALEKILPVLLVLAAIAILVSVALTGDAGARAVWGGGS